MRGCAFRLAFYWWDHRKQQVGRRLSPGINRVLRARVVVRVEMGSGMDSQLLVLGGGEHVPFGVAAQV